jgi:hypothetical protein
MDAANHRPGALTAFVRVRGAGGGDGSGGGGGVGGSSPHPRPTPQRQRTPAGSALSDMFDCLAPPPPPHTRGGAAAAAVVGDAGAGDVLALQLGAPVAEGQPLLISYGAKDGAALAAWYGFALPGNPAEALRLTLQRRDAVVAAGQAAAGLDALRLAVVGARGGAGDAGWVDVGSGGDGGGGDDDGGGADPLTLQRGVLPESLVEAVLAARHTGGAPASGGVNWAELRELAAADAAYGAVAVAAACEWTAAQLRALAHGMEPPGAVSPHPAVALAHAYRADLAALLREAAAGVEGAAGQRAG